MEHPAGETISPHLWEIIAGAMHDQFGDEVSAMAADYWKNWDPEDRAEAETLAEENARAERESRQSIDTGRYSRLHEWADQIGAVHLLQKSCLIVRYEIVDITRLPPSQPVSKAAPTSGIYRSI